MRITKRIKGEDFPFRVKLVYNSMTAEVKWLFDDVPVIGTISGDFNYIILPDDYFSPYISGHGRVKVGRLKLNKRDRLDAMDCNDVKL